MDYISREDALKWCRPEEWDTPDERWRPESEFGQMIKALPAADVAEVIRCKECKYFETDSWIYADNVPIIAAHETCNKWGDGCKTSQDGYCFIAERREASEKEDDHGKL